MQSCNASRYHFGNANFLFQNGYLLFNYSFTFHATNCVINNLNLDNFSTRILHELTNLHES